MAMKQKLHTFFREKEQERTLKEQIDILNKLLISKEESLKAKESQCTGMRATWLDKENKLTKTLTQKDHSLSAALRKQEELQIALDEARSNALEWQRRYEVESRERESLRGEVERLERIVIQTQEANHEKSAQIETLEKRCREISERLQDAEEERDVYEAKWRKTNHELDRTRVSEMTKDFIADAESATRDLLEPIEFDGGFVAVEVEGMESAECTEEKVKKKKKEKKELEERMEGYRSHLDDVVRMVLRVGRFLRDKRVKEALRDDRSELLEIEREMEGYDVQLEADLDRVEVYKEMLTMKQRLVEQYRQRFAQMDKEMLEIDADDRLWNTKVKKLEMELQQRRKDVGSSKKQREMMDELGLKELQIDSIHRKLEELSSEMKEKESNLEELFQTIRSAECELANKENEYFSLSQKVINYQTRLRQKEKELSDLQQQTQRLEESIEESAHMAMVYSDIFKAKEEALRAKECIIQHFEELMSESDEQLQARDEQVATLFENLKNTSIIDNYQS